MKPSNADGTPAATNADGSYTTAPPPLHPYAVAGGPSPIMVAQTASPSPDPCMSVLIVMWVIILPPVAVALAGGDLASILINVLFTCLGYLPVRFVCRVACA